jgi:hypothetical protein
MPTALCAEAWHEVPGEARIRQSARAGTRYAGRASTRERPSWAMRSASEWRVVSACTNNAFRVKGFLEERVIDRGM